MRARHLDQLHYLVREHKGRVTFPLINVAPENFDRLIGGYFGQTAAPLRLAERAFLAELRLAHLHDGAGQVTKNLVKTHSWAENLAHLARLHVLMRTRGGARAAGFEDALCG